MRSQVLMVSSIVQRITGAITGHSSRLFTGQSAQDLSESLVILNTECCPCVTLSVRVSTATQPHHSSDYDVQSTDCSHELRGLVRIGH